MRVSQPFHFTMCYGWLASLYYIIAVTSYFDILIFTKVKQTYLHKRHITEHIIYAKLFRRHTEYIFYSKAKQAMVN